MTYVASPRVTDGIRRYGASAGTSRSPCDWRFTSLLDVVAYISCRARAGHVSATPARGTPIQIRYIFSARGTPVLRFRPGTSISRTRVTRLVSVAFSVAFPCGMSPARRRGRGHIVNSSMAPPAVPRPASRPTPGPRLGSAVHNCDSDLLCAASRMPLRIPCVLVRSRSLLARFFHTCRHTWLKASPPTLAPPRSPSRIQISYCGSLLHTLSVAGAARSSSTGPILD